MSTARLEPMTGTPTETLTEALRSKLSYPVTSPQFDVHAGVNEVLKDVGLAAADSGGRYARTDSGLRDRCCSGVANVPPRTSYLGH